jgi:hypothetical protein
MGKDMGGNRQLNRGGLLSQLVRQTGFYSKSIGFFLVIGLVLVAGYFLVRGGLLADEPLTGETLIDDAEVIYYDLGENGSLYLGKTQVGAEIFKNDATYRYRYQVINQPDSFIESLQIAVRLPKAGTEETVGHRLINNGGASTAESELYSPQVILYTAKGINPETQLAIEFEVPKAFITRSATLAAREWVASLPLSVWASISIGLPALTLLLLLVVTAARARKVTPLNEELQAPPSRLSPALLGILLNGRLSSRELAATLLDLARRGHLVIRHISSDDFRFTRSQGSDKLEDFEQALLDQIFGPAGTRASNEEISFSLAQEVFSKRVSKSFILVYNKINDLGFFYTNPLKLHLRYQITGLILFVIGVIGFFANLFLFVGLSSFLFFWIGMIMSALLVIYLSKGLPVRTVYGDRELAKWLAFVKFMAGSERVNFAAHSQEKYLAYLPYAIVFGVEVEWTRKFYELPFVQPSWYIASNITTIDQFANKVFPLFGYLSHVLSLSAQPSAR